MVRLLLKQVTAPSGSKKTYKVNVAYLETLTLLVGRFLESFFSTHNESVTVSNTALKDLTIMCFLIS